MWRTLVVLFGLLMCMACQTATLGLSKPVSAGALSEEYERSSAGVRSKYDGKEIIVRGYTAIAAKMPQPGDDQGSVFLKEKGRDQVRQVTCWFSKDQGEEFSKIKGGQYVTVKGVFNGEGGVDLKFCKLVKIE